MATSKQSGSRGVQAAGAPPSGLGAVQERWDFYRDEARRWAGIAKVALGAVAGLLVLLPAAYYAGREPGHIIAINRAGQVVRIPEVTVPDLSNAAIRRFCADSVAEVGTFGFNDFGLRMSQMADLFTDAGWKSFNDSLMREQIPQAIKEYNQTYATTPASPCEVVKKGMFNDRYGWLVKVKVVRRISSGGQQQDEALTVTMVLVRVGIAQARELVAIDRWKEGP